MATIIAEAADTAVEVTFTISNASGPVTGLTVAASCYDRARDGGDGNTDADAGASRGNAGEADADITDARETMSVAERDQEQAANHWAAIITASGVRS